MWKKHGCTTQIGDGRAAEQSWKLPQPFYAELPPRYVEKGRLPEGKQKHGRRLSAYAASGNPAAANHAAPIGCSVVGPVRGGGWHGGMAALARAGSLSVACSKPDNDGR